MHEGTHREDYIGRCLEDETQKAEMKILSLEQHLWLSKCWLEFGPTTKFYCDLLASL